MRILVVAIAAVCAGLLAAAPSRAQAPPPGMRSMPPEIESLFRAANNEINGASRCEVIDWAANPANGMPAEAQRLARRQVDICVLPHDDLTPEVAALRLGNEPLRIDVENGVLTVLARSGGAEVTACCGPQMDLSRLGDSDYWGARRRIAGSDRAMISLALIGQGRPIRTEDWRTHRGPNAPPKPAETEIGKWKGKLLQPEFQSHALGETRELAIYLPPGWSKDKAWPALFMGDAGAVEFAGLVEKMIEAGEIRPIVIISAESGANEIRSAEYLRFWPQGGDRFDHHMEFFAKELVDYAIAEFGVSTRREDRAVSGKSNGGVLAAWAGILHPDAFAHAAPMSPGYLTLKPEHLAAGQRARFFVSGGMYEPPYIAAARAAESTLRDAGYNVTGRYYAAGHYHDQWAVALRAALLEIFPPS